MSAKDDLDRFDAQWRDWQIMYRKGPGAVVMCLGNIGVPLPIAMQQEAKERVLYLLGEVHFRVRMSLVVRAKEEAKRTLAELDEAPR